MKKTQQVAKSRPTAVTPRFHGTFLTWKQGAYIEEVTASGNHSGGEGLIEVYELPYCKKQTRPQP